MVKQIGISGCGAHLASFLESDNTLESNVPSARSQPGGPHSHLMFGIQFVPTISAQSSWSALPEHLHLCLVVIPLYLTARIYVPT